MQGVVIRRTFASTNEIKNVQSYVKREMIKFIV